MNSIQKRLTLIVLATTLAMLLIAGGSLYAYVRFELLDELDHSLDSQARVLSSTVRIHSDGSITLEAAKSAIEIRSGSRPPRDLFELRAGDKAVLFRSAALGQSHLAQNLPDTGRASFDITLPDGRAARVRRLTFIPTPDDDDLPMNSAASAATTPSASLPLVVFLAHDREEIDETLHTILTSLFVTALLLTLAICIGIPSAVRRGLVPLRQIAMAVDRIRVDSLDDRFSPGQMPAELAPICNRLNELLTRLHDAFQRERRFSSDVAHELRTPIAELRTMAEVALRWPPDALGMTRNLHETLDVARQMEAVVTTLLTIARCEAGAESIRVTTFCIGDAIKEAWAPHEAKASARNLGIDWQLKADELIATDRTMLVQLFSNLFSNAVNYTFSGGHLRCVVETDSVTTQVIISNPTDQLTEIDLPWIFDPFWRKDPSRTDSSHSGLGLAIVASYARILGLRLATSIRDGRFSIGIAVPSNAPVEEASLSFKASLRISPPTLASISSESSSS